MCTIYDIEIVSKFQLIYGEGANWVKGPKRREGIVPLWGLGTSQIGIYTR